MKRYNLLLIPITILLFNQVYGQDYVPGKETVPEMSRYKAQLELDKLLKMSVDNFYWWSTPPYKMNSVTYQINDSSFVLNYKYDATTVGTRTHTVRYSKLVMPSVEKTKRHGNKITFKTEKTGKEDNESYIFYGDYEVCKQIVNALFLLKNKDQKKEDDKELEEFKLTAQNYTSLVVKPALKEDVRRYLVQATTATEEKRYADGIDLLDKAIAADPTYPQAHFNQALLWAQVSIYGAAILEMKKYLMLVPDAADARASQDKIYEWEGKLNK